jgi:hypothetical protein
MENSFDVQPLQDIIHHDVSLTDSCNSMKQSKIRCADVHKDCLWNSAHITLEISIHILCLIMELLFGC